MGLFSRRKRRRRTGLVAIPTYRRPTSQGNRVRLSPRARRSLVILGAIVVAYFFIVGERGLWRLLSLTRYHGELAADELALTAEVVDLEARHRLLETDTSYIEMVARTEYRLARPDETVFELVPPPDSVDERP
jgi:cell division protein FtsB